MKLALKNTLCQQTALLSLICILWAGQVHGRVFGCYRALDSGELNSGLWVLCGRAEGDGPGCSVRMTGNVFSEDIEGRTDYFRTECDSVFWAGYNVGRSFGAVARPAVYLALSNVFGDIDLTQAYVARCRRDVHILSCQNGVVTFKTAGVGKAVVAPGDTVDNVVLTRQTIVWISDEAGWDSSDSCRREVWRWHRAGSFAPFAIQTGNCLYIDTSASSETPKKDKEKPDGADGLRDLIDRAEMTVGDRSLTVKFETPVDVRLCLMDTSGNIYFTQSGMSNNFDIDISTLTDRRYILTLTAQTAPFYERKILVNLNL